MTPTARDAPELADFRASVRALSRSRLLDGYLHRARVGGPYPRDMLRTLGDNGLLGLIVPEDRGGQSAGLHALGIACEETAYADGGASYQVFATNVTADLLARFASPEVVDRWLAPVMAGEVVCAIALTEPGSGSDARALTSRAERVEGGWELSGEKTSVTQAPDADLAIVMARESDGGQISAFVVPMDQPGLSGQRFDDPGMRAIGRGSIAMDRVHVPDSHRLGEGGRGFALIMGEFDLTRTLIAFMVPGITHRALDLTIEHVRTRTTFGRPLSSNQGVSFRSPSTSPILRPCAHSRSQRWTRARRGARTRSRRRCSSGGPPRSGSAPSRTASCCTVTWRGPRRCRCRRCCGTSPGSRSATGPPQIQKLIIARDAIGPEVMAR